MSGAFEWKEDQRRALDHAGDLVLTASAGTGKTTILVERFIATLLREARAGQSGDILRRMVAITFTELAAAELKERLRARIVDELEQNPDAGWLQLIERDLDSAYIGTIHGFCRRLLKENFVAAGLSPAFGVIDEDENYDLKLEAAGEVVRAGLAESRLMLEIAGELGFQRTRYTIISLLDALHADGIEEIDPQTIVTGHREIWRREVEELLHDLLHRLREMHAAISAFNRGETGGKASTTTLGIEETIVAALEPLAAVQGKPETIFAGELPAGLFEVTRIRKPTNAGLEEFKEMLEAFRLLVGHDETREPVALRDYLSVDAQQPYVLEVLAATAEYGRRFQRAKDVTEQVDFDDLLLRARSLLRDNEEVRRRYHAQFAFLFVDEFQDVNALQREIIELLHGDPGQRLFIVGDGKQSIYRFRAADVLRYREFCETLSARGGSQLELSSNFRSAPSLLRSFNALFADLFEKDEANPYQIEYQSFVPGKTGAEGHPLPIELITYTTDDRRHEGMLIARRIGELVGSRTMDGRPIRYGDIAILMRKFTAIAPLETELRRAGIPYTVIGGRGFYLQREIWDLASYLQLVYFADDHYALAAVLRSPLCLISDETLMRLARTGCLNAGCFEKAEQGLFDAHEWDRFVLLRDLVVRHRTQLDALPVSGMLVEVLDRSGFEGVLLARDGGDQGAANARKLIELARQFEERDYGSPQEFILALQAGLFSNTGEPQALVADLEGQAVKILTVHKSKGLEFPFVILPHFHGKSAFESERLAYERRTGIGFRLRQSDGDSRKKQFDIVRRIRGELTVQEEAEELRLLYVAMTRAKESVIIPWVEKPNSGGPSWWRRLTQAEPLTAENAVRFGINIVAENDLPERERPRSAAEEFGIVIPAPWPGSPAVEPVIERLIETALGPDPRRREREFRGGVWQLIHRICGGMAPEDLELERAALDRAYAAAEEHPAISRAEIGAAVHAALEVFADGRPDAATVSSFLRAQSIDAIAADEAAAHVERWLNSENGRIIAGAKLRREVPFLLSLRRENALIEVGGTIDALAELPDGELWLLDYKYAHRKSPAREYELQLRLYAAAIERAFGRLPDRALLIYLRDADPAADVDVHEALVQATVDEAFRAI